MTSDGSATVAILAGGKSQRMGQDKGALLLHNRPMVEHVLDRVGSLNLPIILIANQPDKYHIYKLPTYTDIFPDRG